MIKYFNKFNDMVYWLDGDTVMCDEPDGCDPMPSAFSREEFLESIDELSVFEKME